MIKKETLSTEKNSCIECPKNGDCSLQKTDESSKNLKTVSINAELSDGSARLFSKGLLYGIEKDYKSIALLAVNMLDIRANIEELKRYIKEEN